MPTYEYYCETCTNHFEVTCSMSAHVTRTRCPKCGDEADQTFTRVATRDDHPVWIDRHLQNQIQGDDGPRIESRSQLERYCKERNIVPLN